MPVRLPTENTTKSHAKMAKITAEICDNGQIHGKITASTVNSEHGPEALIVNI